MQKSGAVTEKAYPLTEEYSRKARLLSLAGSPTRVRILCMLFDRKKACVTEIADSLDMSVASISHHLQLLRDNGLVTTERQGNTICYHLVDTPFTRTLKKIICG